MDETRLDETLSSFANADDIGSLTELANLLLKEKAVNQARRDERFRHGLRKCVDTVASGESDTEKLQGLSIAYRLGAASKPVATDVRRLAVPHLGAPLPPLEILEDGEDRYYASLALSDAQGEWVVDFAARAVAREETAEKARSTVARRLISLVPLSEAINKITAEIRQLSFTTENPAESASKRLRRIIAAIRPAIISEIVPPGNDLGKSLGALFTGPFLGKHQSLDTKALEQLAAECCALVYDILRTQLSVLAEPDIYESLSPVRKWMGSGMWARFSNTNDSGQRVVESLEDALVLLGKQGVTDQRLLDKLTLFTESKKSAEKRANRLAKDHPELGDEVREWLSRFGQTRSKPVLTSMDESRESSSDADIASLLILAESLRCNPHKSSAKIEQLVGEIHTLAKKRGLQLALEVGATAEYSASAHELAGGPRQGVRNVKVVSPLVQRQQPNGVVTIVRKALVEPIGGGDE